MNKNTKWDSVILPERGWFDIHLKEVFQYNDLLWILVKRDITTLYKQTILGPIWLILQPLLSTIVFTVIFSGIANISTDDLPPILFYMSGIIAWNYFASCLSNTSSTFISNAGLFGKVYFPRIIVPFSKVISGLTRFFVQLLLFLGFYFYYIMIGNKNIDPSLETFILLPLFVFQMAILGQGLGMFIAGITIKYRDLSYLVGFGTQLLMYASPIVYPLSVVPDRYRYIIDNNPMTPVIEGFRYAFIGRGTIDLNSIFQSIFVSIIVFFIGLIIFNKMEKDFIDKI
tara:strand:- start:2706 stop:3560 length:855 start_codon:yes stop_codon:yes gene_type:complete